MKEYDEIKARSPIPLLGRIPLAQDKQAKHLQNIEQDQKTLLTFVISSLDHLSDTIKDSDKKNDALGAKMFWLAVIGVALTATQIIPAVETLRQWFHWW